MIQTTMLSPQTKDKKRGKITHDVKLPPSKCDEIINGLRILMLPYQEEVFNDKIDNLASDIHLYPMKGDKIYFYADKDDEIVYHTILKYYGIIKNVDRIYDKIIIYFDLYRGGKKQLMIQ